MPKSFKTASGPTLQMRRVASRYVGLLSFRHVGEDVKVQAWPRKRGKRGTPAQLKARADFANMVAIVNGNMDASKVGARMIAEGSSYTWRDVLSRAAVGELLDLQNPEIVMVKTFLDQLGLEPGSIIVCTPDGWQLLDPPGTDSVLAYETDSQSTVWVDQSSIGGGGGGLMSAILDPVPTMAGTDLTVLANAGTSTAIDTAAGILLTAQSGSNTPRTLAHATALTPPFTRTALLSMTGAPENGQSLGIGFYDMSSKVECIWFNWFNGAALLVAGYTFPGSYGGNISTRSIGWMPQALRLENDGSKIRYSVSGDGINFDEVYNHFLNDGFLASTAYGNPCFAFAPGGATRKATLQGWV